MHTNTHTHKHTHTHTDTRTWIHMRLHTHLHTHKHSHTLTHLHTQIHIYPRIHKLICICTHKQIQICKHSLMIPHMHSHTGVEGTFISTANAPAHLNQPEVQYWFSAVAYWWKMTVTSWNSSTFPHLLSCICVLLVLTMAVCLLLKFVSSVNASTALNHSS